MRPATSDVLLFTFQRCHNYIAGNQGLQKPDAFWELLKLIFCKIEDERSSEIDFYATSKERQGLNGHLKVKDRVEKLFDGVRHKYSTIFTPNDVVELEPRVLAYLVSQLQPWSLLESDIDVKGKAYEEIVGSNLRGDRGEFFTPRNICGMAVAMLDPGAYRSRARPCLWHRRVLDHRHEPSDREDPGERENEVAGSREPERRRDRGVAPEDSGTMPISGSSGSTSTRIS